MSLHELPSQPNGRPALVKAESTHTSRGMPQWALWQRQAWAVFRIEFKKNFSSGRRVGIYFLAFVPVLIIAVHSLDLSHRRQSHISFVKHMEKPITRRDFLDVTNGMTSAEVFRRLGTPHVDFQRVVPRPMPVAAEGGQPAAPRASASLDAAPNKRAPGGGAPEPGIAPNAAIPAPPAPPGAPTPPHADGAQAAQPGPARQPRLPPNFMLRQRYHYAVADEDMFVIVDDGKVVVTSIEPLPTESIEDDTAVFAEIFQIYYVRLGIFFGCMGIFTWLIRGEIVERHLHYYFLAPLRREVIVVGKFLAGACSAIIVFCAGVAISFVLIYSSFGSAGTAYIFSGPGLGQLGSYLIITVLACLGYGATALALSLIFKNIAVPGLILLGWETINSALPPLLQKLSVTHYLKQLVPIQVPPHGLLALFTVVTEPVPPAVAAAGLLALTAGVLIFACWYVPRLEIDYVTD